MSDNTSELRDVIAQILSANWNHMHTNEALGRQRMLADAVIACLPNHGYTITDLHPEIATTEELDALPEYTVVRSARTERADAATYYEKYHAFDPKRPMRDTWLELDPGDRNDGEQLCHSYAVLYGNKHVTVVYRPDTEETR